MNIGENRTMLNEFLPIKDIVEEMLLAVGSATDIKKLKDVSVKKRPTKEYLLYT